ncbi:MAG: carbohydrate ABC transporter permease [Clostridiales bacterium]|jgi:ABC-type glycerol-3-phosphate transport system permease component|nr:carbohydrate ABC transporter permease [Clostridiales bacterium]
MKKFFHFGNRVGARATRSTIGNGFVVFILGILGLFMATPMVYTINVAFKPVGELLKFPPDFFVQNPTLDNFANLSNAVSNSVVPFSRYLANSLFISIIGTAGNVLLSSLAAYPLAKHKFPGRNFIFSLIVLSLMFSPVVLSVPRYLEMSAFGWLDSYYAIVVPMLVTSLGLYLMKQFMEQINDAILEAARIDGAGELATWWYVVMPAVKPAYLTLILFAFKDIWNDSGSVSLYITTESQKTLPLALMTIMQGGLPRLGSTSVVGFLMMIPPILTFFITQSNVIETMKSSGMKD